MVSAGVLMTSSNSNVSVSSNPAKVTEVSAAASSFGDVYNKSLTKINTNKSQDFSEIKTNVQSDKRPVENNDTKPTVKNEKVNDTKDLTDKVEEVVEEIREEIKSKLDITDEQLDEILASMGIQITDLLDSSNLTQFVVQATGQENVIDILTQSDLSETLKELTAFVNDKVTELATAVDMQPQEVKQFVLEEYKVNDDADEEAFEVEQVVVEKTNDLASKITVESESSSDNLSDFLKDSGAKETKTDNSNTIVDSIANNLTQSIDEAIARIVTDENPQVNATDIVRQIIDSVKVTTGQTISAMEIQLNPENLGRVNLSVATENGVVTAKLVAENEQVKRALETQLTILKDNLNNQGIKIEAVEVTIASHSFDANANLQKDDSQSQQQSQRSRRNISLDGFSDAEDEVSQETNNTLGENSSVEYTA